MNKTKSVITLTIFVLLIVFLAVFTFMPVKLPMGNYDYCSPINQIIYSMDLVDGYQISYKIDGASDTDKLDATLSVLQNRLDLIEERLGVEGISDSIISINDNILNIQLPSDEKITQATIFDILGSQGELVISLNENGSNPFIPYDQEGNELSWAECIESCQAIYDSTATSNPYGINLTVNEYGLEALKEGTADVTESSTIYFILDGTIIGQPSITAQITTASSQITGYSSVQAAHTLAIQFVSGEYPLTITNTSDYTTVDSMLGQDALKLLYIAVMAVILVIVVFFIIKNGVMGWALTLSFLAYLVLSAFAFAYLPLGQTAPLMAIVGFVFSFVLYALLNSLYSYIVRRQFSSSDKKSFQTAMMESFKTVVKIVIDVCVVVFIIAVVVTLIAIGSLKHMALAVAICDVVCVLFTLLVTKGFFKLFGGLVNDSNKIKLSAEVE